MNEETTPQQQQAEPVTWDKPSASFDQWWDSDRRRDTANPFTTDSFAYWAFEGWQAALAQVEQEPVAWMTINECGEEDDIHYENPEGHLLEGWTYKPLYTHPPTAQRPWQGLTDEEIFHAGPRIGTSDSNVNPYQILINARAIEAKLKERNT